MEDERKRAMLEAIQKLSGKRFEGSNFDEDYGSDEEMEEALGMSEQMSGMLSSGEEQDAEMEEYGSDELEDDSNDLSLDALRQLSSDNSAEPEGEYAKESYDDDYGMRTYGPEDTEENPLEEEDDEYKLDGYSRK